MYGMASRKASDTSNFPEFVVKRTALIIFGLKVTCSTLDSIAIVSRFALTNVKETRLKRSGSLLLPRPRRSNRWLTQGGSFWLSSSLFTGVPPLWKKDRPCKGKKKGKAARERASERTNEWTKNERARSPQTPSWFSRRRGKEGRKESRTPSAVEKAKTQTLLRTYWTFWYYHPLHIG